MSDYLDRVALLYHYDGYKEAVPGSVRDGSPYGLMGRQVAGKEFLDAFVAHGRWTELVGLVLDKDSADSLTAYWKSLPAAQTQGRSLRLIDWTNFHRQFLGQPPAPVLHFSNPIDARYAWARQHGGAPGFALSGITHTICSWTTAQAFCEMVTAPLEPFDTLICVSRQALATIQGLAQTYADHLRERFGGDPRLRATLAHIPYGVNTEKYRPATAEERAAARAALGAAPDEVVVLFVGRLSFHGKVHPYPMYAGVAQAARQTGVKVRLVLAGWAANKNIQAAFHDGARDFAPGVTTAFVDGTRPEWRYAVWRAADVATSLTDNIQETLSQVILEGMACGLPVVVTNWDGCKDEVVDGETGLLVPAYMVRGATRDLTSRLILGEINYDHFLAECNQTVAVDVGATAGAFARLLADPGLRRRLGEAARRHILERFNWAGVVRAHEELWARQDAERRAFLARRPAAARGYAGPACYPAPEDSFASYPTAILEGTAVVRAADDAPGRLAVLLRHPLTNYSLGFRTNSPEVLTAVLSAAGRPARLDELDGVFAGHGLGLATARATLGWLLKYDLLRVVNP
jgi:glycosyltransferase involved in cell wall biosynthesis